MPHLCISFEHVCRAFVWSAWRYRQTGKKRASNIVCRQSFVWGLQQRTTDTTSAEREQFLNTGVTIVAMSLVGKEGWTDLPRGRVRVVEIAATESPVERRYQDFFLCPLQKSLPCFKGAHVFWQAVGVREIFRYAFHERKSAGNDISTRPGFTIECELRSISVAEKIMQSSVGSVMQEDHQSNIAM